MARKKLSEFRAKTVLNQAIQQEYVGWELDAQADWQAVVGGLDDSRRYVIKVDQAEKGRFKKGLVKLDQPKDAVTAAVEGLFSTGYRFVLVEVFQPHEADAEWYLSIERTRRGIELSFSKTGGIDVESQAEPMKTVLYADGFSEELDLPAEKITALVKTFDQYHFSFLEINPLLMSGNTLQLLDAAVEVDGEGEFFEDGWDASDLRQPKGRAPTAEEIAVEELAAKSQASFSLEVINPNGSIFVLLSGGGASVVVADEVNNLGFGKELANYGEYSGNPNFEETRIYTEQIVKLLLASDAPRKVLIIGGGVANFTDVRTTFKGVIAGMQAHEDELKQQQVTVFVRRGGPHEREGLAAIREYLEGLGIAGTVAGPELLLSSIVEQAVQGVKA